MTDGPDLKIVEFNMGVLKGVRGEAQSPPNPYKYKSADMGVSVRSTGEIRKEWLREGADLSPTARHRIARIGARFWNAGNQTFRIGTPFEAPGVYKKWPVDNATWQVAINGLWRFELSVGAERDLQRGQNIQAVIALTNDADGNPPPPVSSWQDFTLPPGYAAESQGDPYYNGMVFDLTDITDTDASVPFYWFKMILDPDNRWGQLKSIEFKVTLRHQEFLPYPTL